MGLNVVVMVISLWDVVVMGVKEMSVDESYYSEVLGLL